VVIIKPRIHLPRSPTTNLAALHHRSTAEKSTRLQHVDWSATESAITVAHSERVEHATNGHRLATSSRRQHTRPHPRRSAYRSADASL